LLVGVVSLAATLWFGFATADDHPLGNLSLVAVSTAVLLALGAIVMNSKKKVHQKQEQQGEGVKVQTQTVGEQKQAQRGSGNQTQTLKLED